MDGYGGESLLVPARPCVCLRQPTPRSRWQCSLRGQITQTLGPRHSLITQIPPPPILNPHSLPLTLSINPLPPPPPLPKLQTRLPPLIPHALQPAHLPPLLLPPRPPSLPHQTHNAF